MPRQLVREGESMSQSRDAVQHDARAKVRDSNLELMRIILMLLIVAHHYVVNSGVTALWTPSTLTASGAFLTLWGMWGKAVTTPS